MLRCNDLQDSIVVHATPLLGRDLTKGLGVVRGLVEMWHVARFAMHVGCIIVRPEGLNHVFCEKYFGPMLLTLL